MNILPQVAEAMQTTLSTNKENKVKLPIHFVDFASSAKTALRSKHEGEYIREWVLLSGGGDPVA